MENKIGEKIKQLRKKAGLTQEKVAEYLGVTFQSVSRWENGAAYPDIQILPAIANYFNVTTDELLGVDDTAKREKMEEIMAQIRKNFSKGLTDKNIEVCRIAVNEFPNDYNLLSYLASFLGQKKETKKEALSINERILTDCADDNIRYGAIQQLAYLYKDTGEIEKAIETAKKLPYMPVTSDIILATIYDGVEKIQQLKYNIEHFCDFITRDIISFAVTKYDGGNDAENAQKRIALYKKAVSVYETIYENGDYGFYNTRMNGLYLAIAASYMILSDFENALYCIEKAADYAIAFDTLPEVFTHTSMISEHREFSKAKNLAKDFDYTDSYGMLHDYLSQEKYNPIRETKRFKAVTARLEKYAAKEA